MDGMQRRNVRWSFSLLTTTVLKGFNNCALFPANSEHRKEGHHVKVRSIGGWADGAKG